MPLLLASRRIDCIQVRVPATGVHDAIHDGGRRLEADLVVDNRIFTTVKPPFLDSGPSIDRIEVTIPASKEHNIIGVRGRSVDDVARLEFPFQLAGKGVERINVAVTAPKID